MLRSILLRTTEALAARLRGPQPTPPVNLIEDEGRWIARVPREHLCTPPLLGVDDMAAYGVGSRWACRCGSMWEIKRWSTPGGHADFTPEWEAISGSPAVEIGHIVIVNPTAESASDGVARRLRDLRRGDGSPED